jgi:type IV pilus assembly protein PilX
MQASFATITAARGKQRGATLIVGLVLLLVLTVLGVSGMNTATMEVTMAGNVQFQQDAFQLAENGIDTLIAEPIFSTDETAPTTLEWLADDEYDRRSEARFRMTTPVPEFASSLGTEGGVQAFHFDIVSVGRGPRNATSTHTQSFYIVGPGGP